MLCVLLLHFEISSKDETKAQGESFSTAPIPYEITVFSYQVFHTIGRYRTTTSADDQENTIGLHRAVSLKAYFQVA